MAWIDQIMSATTFLPRS